MSATYPKNIPTLRFPEFDKEWDNQKLGDIAKFSKGKGISKTETTENGKLPCIRYGELYTHYKETINDVKSNTDVPVNQVVLSKRNDVIIPASGESQLDIATAACILNEGIALGGDINIIRTKHNGVFLSYYLNNKKKIDIARLSQGISVVHLYAAQLKLLDLNLPETQEQQKIAAFLSSVDTKIKQLEKKKTLLEQYKKGMMQQIFPAEAEVVPKLRFPEFQDAGDWLLISIGKKVDLLSGCPIRGTEISENSSGVPLLRGINITEGFIRHNQQIDRYFIGDSNIYEKYRLKENDLVIGMDGSKVGKNCALITNDDSRSLLIQRVARLRAKSKADIQLVFQQVNSNRFHSYVDRINTSGGIPHISAKQIDEFDIRFPQNEKEQQKVAGFLSAIDKKIELVSIKLEEARTFKKGLLQQMFV